MDLNRALENKALRELLEEYIESYWCEFFGGYINDEDEAQGYLHEFIDNAVIYTHDCEKILFYLSLLMTSKYLYGVLRQICS